MNKGYLYISNGRVAPREVECSLDPISTGSFEAASIYAAHELGFQLYMGVNREYAEQLTGVDYDITFYNQHIYRNILNIRDLWIGYKNLCRFLKLHHEIAVLHCNTPIGGVLGRICGKKYGKKVIYMAHGFHFYKGSPLINRTIFKFIERRMAHKTNCLITINQEDYEAAQSFKLCKGGRVFKVNGVGINTLLYDGVIVDKNSKRESIGVPEDAFLGIVVGDLNDNKNVKTLIKALPYTAPNVHYIICGTGPEEKRLKEMAKLLRVEERCHFLGYRTDVKELYLTADVFLFASKREGLPRSTMEAMACGLPCIVSKIRGNVDLIDDKKGGYLVPCLDYKSFAIAINDLLSDPIKSKSMGAYNKEKIKCFDIGVVRKQMVEIFSEVL